MKSIRTSRGIIIESFDNKPATYSADSTYEEIIKPYEENKLKILESAFMIESHLNMIISYYFFGRNIPENKEKELNFKSLILASDWCSFSSKRKLIAHIVNDLSILKGAKKNEYEILLKKTMSYRNAFAHGTMSTNGEIVKLKYFEGAPISKTIDDDYLTIIESDLNKAFNMSMEVALLSGAIVKHE